MITRLLDPIEDLTDPKYRKYLEAICELQRHSDTFEVFVEFLNEIRIHRALRSTEIEGTRSQWLQGGAQNMKDLVDALESARKLLKIVRKKDLPKNMPQI